MDWWPNHLCKVYKSFRSVHEYMLPVSTLIKRYINFRSDNPIDEFIETILIQIYIKKIIDKIIIFSEICLQPVHIFDDHLETITSLLWMKIKLRLLILSFSFFLRLRLTLLNLGLLLSSLCTSVLIEVSASSNSKLPSFSSLFYM